MRSNKITILVLSILLMFIALLLLLTVFVLFSKAEKNVVPELKFEENNIEIIREEQEGAEISSETYVLTIEESDNLLSLFNFENIEFSDDVLKMAFEKSYTIKVNDTQSLLINRMIAPSDEQTYMMYMTEESDNIVIFGAYIDSYLIHEIDSMILNEEKFN